MHYFLLVSSFSCAVWFKFKKKIKKIPFVNWSPFSISHSTQLSNELLHGLDQEVPGCTETVKYQLEPPTVSSCNRPVSFRGGDADEGLGVRGG